MLTGIAALLSGCLIHPWLLVPGIILFAFFANFFRNPERRLPAGECLVSPADGKIVVVRPLDPDQNDGYTSFVSIFMNVFDVHVNRAPMAGRISGYEYFPGKFKPAFEPAATLENERNRVTIEGDRCRIQLSQVAGLLARRILFWKKIGDTVGRGERIGMICFGSRVDVWLPPGVVPAVKPGQRVKAASSILAGFTNDK